MNLIQDLEQYRFVSQLIKTGVRTLLALASSLHSHALLFLKSVGLLQQIIVI